jgi:hypothetical protein
MGKRNLSHISFVLNRADASASWQRSKGQEMNFRERYQLRTRLRQVNIEFSALVRDTARDRRFARIDELRLERRQLMSLLFGNKHRDDRAMTAHQQMLAVTILHAAE